MGELDQAELGALAAGAVRAVVSAQHVLDDDASRRAAAYVEAPAGTLALPPLWYTFQAVEVEIQVSAAVGHVVPERGDPALPVLPVLLCRTVNPATVGLYGYAAAAGMTVRFTVAPYGPLPVVPAAPEPS